MLPDDSDRDLILRRRAFLVRSTLSGVVAASTLTGCPQDSPQPAAPVATVPSTDAGTLPDTEGSATVAPQPPKAKIPPLTVPDDVNATAKGHFERLKQLVPFIHAELDAASKLARSICDIQSAACDGSWEALADHLAKARDLQRDLHPRCSGSSEDAKRFAASLRAHEAAIDARFDAIDARLQRVLDTQAKERAWTKRRSEASKPQPCLRYRCDDW